jgi:hypothetical protein
MNLINTALPLFIIATLLSSCSSTLTKELNYQLCEVEKLGITHAEISGKFSTTEYNVTFDGEMRKAEVRHNNPWLTKVHIVRETPKDNPICGQVDESLPE